MGLVPGAEAPNLGRAAFSRRSKALSALGVFAAVVLAVNANVLVSRWYRRWDVTSEGLYTLSQATKGALSGLASPLSVVVLLSRTDPLLPRVRQMLTAYGAETTRLEVRYVDPERNPAEFVAIQQKYQILAGKAEDGRVVTDAVIVIAQGDQSWFVTADDINAFDDEGRAKPRLEQALTEGIANVQHRERTELCFGEGHRETSLDDVGPEGLSELRHALEKNNLKLRNVNAEQPDADKALKGCRALVIVGPDVAYSAAAAERIGTYVRGGGGLLVFASPIFGEGGKIAVSGLEPLARVAGMELKSYLVLETEESARLPRGAGEVFFATPTAHELTRGLV
ncbi:MAG TPA: GldG family protein, partial [Polyangiaceae bacterium]|nr:GldG family protein [Polyangiaceae bacterium]